MALLHGDPPPPRRLDPRNPRLHPWSWRPKTYKRFSSGVCRLYSYIEVEAGKREWMLVAKRVGAEWRGTGNAGARRKALRELRGGGPWTSKP